MTARRGPARRLSSRRGSRTGRGREPRVQTRSPAPKNAPIRVGWDRLRAWLPDATVRRAARAALAEGGRTDFALSVVFVTDRALQKLHARHLDDPSRTDVITFDLSDEITGPSGEIYASAECAGRRARERGVDPRRELLLYVVHGALHLCGVDDHTRRDRARMRASEARVMTRLGYALDTAPHDE